MWCLMHKASSDGAPKHNRNKDQTTISDEELSVSPSRHCPEELVCRQKRGNPSYPINRVGVYCNGRRNTQPHTLIQPGLSLFVRFHAMPYLGVDGGNRFHDDVRLPGNMMASAWVTRCNCFVKHVTAFHPMFGKKP